MTATDRKVYNIATYERDNLISSDNCPWYKTLYLIVHVIQQRLFPIKIVLNKNQ